MSILNKLQDWERNKKFVAANQAAVDIFLKQRDAIMNISETRGFAEIMNYLDRDIAISESRLDTQRDPVEWARIAGGRDKSRLLKQFLINLSTKPEIPEQEDESS